MAMYRFGDHAPQVPASAYVASGATVIGQVILGEGASVWPSAVVRADNERITVGARTNVQDGAVLHADPGIPLTIGENVSIGHQAMLHGCTIGDGSMIGIQAVILNRAVIGKNCLVGAGAIVTRDVRPYAIVAGNPAREIKRRFADEMIAAIELSQW